MRSDCFSLTYRTVVGSGITSPEHIELAEAMADLETSIGFDRGQVEVKDSALPGMRRVVAMLRRHTTLKMSIEAHCGLDAPEDFARMFSQRRALSVRRRMAEIAEAQGAAGGLADRLLTRAWGNSRPLVWKSGQEQAGRVNARVELFLSHQGWEAPRRRPLSEYARDPRAAFLSAFPAPPAFLPPNHPALAFPAAASASASRASPNHPSAFRGGGGAGAAPADSTAARHAPRSPAARRSDA